MTNIPITVIPGDGIGPSIIEAAINILQHAHCPLTFEYAQAGLNALEQQRQLLPTDTLALIAKNRATLKGPLTTPIGQGFSSINVALRQQFNLYANVRPVRSFAGISSRYQDIDLITVRENTEGMYCGEGQSRSSDGKRAQALSIITWQGAERIARFAYQLATQEKRQKVTIVHKANILKSTSGLFLEVARHVAADYPHIQTEEMIIDAACMKLVMQPDRFDVLLTSNLFGDIISDLCAGLVGGLGMAPGANIGPQVAIFEAVHGSAPDIAGKNIANPSSVILASIQLLDYLGLADKAAQIRHALQATLAVQDSLTQDLGGHSSTHEFTQAVISRL